MQITRGGAVAAGLVLLLGAAGVVYSQRPSSPSSEADPQLVKAVAARAKLPVKTVEAVFEALAPEILLQIKDGGIVTLPKLGKIRIVRVGEHKDMERGTGRVFTVAARNFVTLDADSEVDKVVNAAGVKPNEVVVQFQYNVMPGQTPSQKAGSLKVRSSRTP
jgi:nucleoid DNA-binding protein